MTTKTRKTYIGKERDEESYLGDFGVRKYDYAAGRFTSPDVLWEKYVNWSPYQYSHNNPLSLKDPSGLDDGNDILVGVQDIINSKSASGATAFLEETGICNGNAGFALMTLGPSIAATVISGGALLSVTAATSEAMTFLTTGIFGANLGSSIVAGIKLGAGSAVDKLPDNAGELIGMIPDGFAGRKDEKYQNMFGKGFSLLAGGYSMVQPSMLGRAITLGNELPYFFSQKSKTNKSNNYSQPLVYKNSAKNNELPSYNIFEQLNSY